jgi:hypothetical protein
MFRNSSVIIVSSQLQAAGFCCAAAEVSVALRYDAVPLCCKSKH